MTAVFQREGLQATSLGLPRTIADAVGETLDHHVSVKHEDGGVNDVSGPGNTVAVAMVAMSM